MSKHLISGPALGFAVLVALGCPPSVAAQSAPGPVESEAIRPGDIVRLSVYSNKDLSGEYPVNQYGIVVLPLVGEYDVSRESQRGLRERVIKDLQQIRYARDIEVVVLRRVRVVGEVNQPGVYPLDPTMSIADAVALAGRTQFAREGVVVLRRGGEVIDADLRLDVRVGDSPVRSGDEILVPRRSWMDRNTAALIGGASGLLGLAATLIVALTR